MHKKINIADINYLKLKTGNNNAVFLNEFTYDSALKEAMKIQIAKFEN
jgi:hypothetical protein